MSSGTRLGGDSHAFTADHFSFLNLLVTTPASILVLYCSVRDVRITGPFSTFIIENRPMAQLAVQILSSILSLAQVLVLARLINLSVRRRFARHGMKLETMRMWVDAMQPRINWSLPWELFFPLLLP